MHTRETWVQAIFPRPGRLGANDLGSGGTAQEIQTQKDLPYPLGIRTSLYSSQFLSLCRQKAIAFMFKS